MKKVAVIGAGASGIIAAIYAAKNGHKVTIFEKQKKIARKISISGNGRCNITNRNVGVSHYHGHNPKFVRNVFSRFGLNETIEFFDSIGIPVIEEKKGKMFPYSLQAATVVDALEYELNKYKIEVKLHRRIDKIKSDKNGFIITTAGKENYHFTSIIIAAGGAAYSQLGGSMSGYNLAKSLGHKIFDPFPVILPVNIPLKKLHRLEGIKWDCTVTVEVENKEVAGSFGELLFTKYGISGPATLEVSRWINEAMLKRKVPEIKIDLFSKMNHETLKNFIKNLLVDKKKSIAFALNGILKKRMPEVILEIAGIDMQKSAAKLTNEELEQLINTLKSLSLTPGEVRSMGEAVATAGGVNVDEVNPATMESKKVPGVFIVGELLDIDGDSGGYNLQFAWSTGAIAGISQ